MVMMLPIRMLADEIPIRYVKTDGTYGADGKSWTTAKNNVQEAIDELYSYMTENKLPEGRVYIAAGTYYPSASTETGNENRQHLSFIIYPGVHVYGGFKADNPENNPDQREYYNLESLEFDATSGESEPAKQQPWNFKHKTILSGNLSDGNKEPSFTYDKDRGTYKTIFYGNSYHVVWFATYGFIDATKDQNYGWDETSLGGHARALPYPASIDGCTISGGYAANQSNAGFLHTGYGAGVYMVEGSSLKNCVVEKCVAVTNGGGVYMDGGGSIDGCMIHTCQATGYNVLDGLGGGVCISFNGSVTRSYIVNNSSRSGGGVAISHMKDEYPWRSRAKEDGVPAQQINSTEINVYSPYVTACIVSNNSSTNEAGGVFLNNGGVVNHLTVANNKCYGSDVTYYGRRQGRSGGVYILNGGQVYNSVVWGNECDANSNIQYACHISGSTSTLKPQVYYSGFAMYESTDWSGTTKENVYSIASTNTNTTGNSALYPYFIGIKGKGNAVKAVGAGLSTTVSMGVFPEADLTAEPGSVDNSTWGIPRPISWKPAAISSLVGKGVQVTNSLSGISDWIKHAHTYTDIFGDKYDPISSIGALVRRRVQVSGAMVNNQEQELYAGYDVSQYTGALEEGHSILPDNGSNATLPTIFVDPTRKLTNEDGTSVIAIGQHGIGSSWDTPVAHINDAIDYFRGLQVTDKNDEHYLMYLIDGEYYPCVQILVKGAVGSLRTTTEGRGAYAGDELRTASIRPCSNMRLYGGYPPEAAGTETSGRNQRQHPTRISANVINGDYSNNAAHVFVLSNVKNVIIDGFRLYEANANFGSEQYGGGVLMENESVPSDDRIDMTGNIMRNGNIAHCSATDGAAIYVYSVDDHEAEFHLINMVIRNNTVGDGTDVVRSEGGGVVTARGSKSMIRMDHCNIVNNCGYPLATIASDAEIHAAIYNSVIYANGNTVLDNRKNIVQSLCFNSKANQVKGDYNYLDWDSRVPVGQIKGGHSHRVFCRDMSDHYQKWGIRLADSDGYTIITNGKAEKYFFDTEEQANTYKSAHPAGTGQHWENPIYLDYPFFVNPSRNVGHSLEGDKPMNGGTIDYMPQATNPMVNAAISESRYLWDTDNNPRTYGGDPDVGAVESTELPKGGTVIYVTPNGSGKRDGSSWDNAIAGNTVYGLSNTNPVATGDQYDTANGTTRIINSSTNDPVLTTDNRYCGGYAMSYFTERKEGAVSSTTVTHTWTTEKNVYEGGERPDEYLQNDVHTESTSAPVYSNEGASEEGFTKGWYEDSRYPYGELSGQSRTFWRAGNRSVDGQYNSSPVPEGWTGTFNSSTTNTIDGVSYTGIGDGKYQPIIKSGELKIQNDRTEKFISGLQYAVEQAAIANADKDAEADQLVQVWVSNGTYTDYKGFIMRDKTAVLGGFPAVKSNGDVTTPGENERHALMSSVIDIPRAKDAQTLNPSDYETILQISDVKPINDDKTFNTSAVKFYDNDLSVTEVNATTNYEYKQRTIIHHYNNLSGEQNVTNNYILLPTFNINGKTGSNGNYTLGTATENQDCWHITYPTTQTYYNVDISRQNKNLHVFDYDTGNSIETVNSIWYRFGNGSLTGLRMWQTMNSVEAGSHKLTLDMMGGYRNGTPFDITTPSNIYLHILDANDNDLVSPVLLKCRDYNSPNGTDKDRIRETAFRKNIEFTTTIQGDVKILIEVLDGTRNTTARNATYGTADGGDPNPIPWEYLWDGNSSGDGNNWGTRNPNRREFFITNLKLYKKIEGNEYVEDTDALEDETTNIAVENIPEGYPTTPDVIDESVYTVAKERTMLRKRVLSMPDVAIPTYGPGRLYIGNTAADNVNVGGDAVGHTERVPNSTRTSRESDSYYIPDNVYYKGLTNVSWDGFTIRNGFMYDEVMCHGGGAGVNMYEGGHLRNSIVVDNVVASERSKGGGIFCDGATSSVEGCFVLNNLTIGGTNKTPAQIFAGGMFMYEGTCFNSLFANNVTVGSGGGLGLCVGRFYNNTVTHNTCGNIPNEGLAGGAMSMAIGSSPNLFMANTIIYGNNGTAIRERTGTIKPGHLNPFINCYIQSERAMTSAAFLQHINNYDAEVDAIKAASDRNYGIGNIFVNGGSGTNPFKAEPEHNYDFRLNSGNTTCINAGTTAFATTILQALLYKPKNTETSIRNGAFYKSVESAEMPQNDVVFAEREQDCQIDIGAYEYDAAMDIKPGYEIINGELCAVYYVTANGNDGGDSSGSSPENAACAMKLQNVLDAAGRLKFDLANIANKNEEGYKKYSTSAVTIEGTVTAKKEVYNSESGIAWTDVADQDLANVKHIIVKLADGVYMPTRSTNNNMATGAAEDEILTHSLIVPHGVEMWGGYKFENGANDNFLEYSRDIMTHKSILLSGVKNERSGSIGKAYHVVAFTNHLFDLDGGMEETNEANAELQNIEDRAILDGVFIQDGSANGVNEADKHGGAAVVTNYAHIRNCIIYDNTATKQGGGLYLQPGALVSGCIFKENTADEGGAIYVEEPTAEQLNQYSETERDKAYARVYNSTVVNNTASVKGGGIFFETNIRAKGVVLWQNTANDMNNVAGTFDSEAIQEEKNYPFSYCTVQNNRLPGVNNQEVTGDATEGVRWNTSDKIYWKGQFTTASTAKTDEDNIEYKVFGSFYYIDRVSALVRTGMPYTMYANLRNDYPSLELTDIAGVYRMGYEATDAKGADYKSYFGEDNELVTKVNKYLEIGARALNTQMDLDVESAPIHMTRLFVAKPENVDAQKANALLTSGDPLYSLQGSSMANPFTKFSDALDYIVKLRNFAPQYANTHFEIFVAGGNYYPYQNPLGEEGYARSSTFVLPEAVTIIGGLNPNENYCQSGYDFVKNQSETENDKLTNDLLDEENNELEDKTINGVTLKRAVTDVIREERERFDLNYNNVFEPWEFTRETVFSGSTPRGNENEDNVFHVFTCFADPAHVGTLPDLELPLRQRMIVLDGLTIKEGNARDHEEASINNVSMFYRGGGILVDGSWNDASKNSNQVDPNEKGARDIPLTISDCLFLDNNAIQGGAIFTNGTLNVFSSSFVKNYAQGPKSNANQTSSDRTDAINAIQYTGGGAIATTGDLFCVNTIFANNEAMLGDTKDMMLQGTKGYYQQGFGGVIWGATGSTVKLLNCNLVNNQAVSYPGVYLANPNKVGDMRHFAVNTVFWGNKATGVPGNLSGSFAHIIEINDDVMTFRGMSEKRNLSTPSGVETMYFCAYEEGTGPKDVKATEGEPHAIAFTGDWNGIRESMKAGGIYYNNNVVINADNDDVDGPNFQLASTAPGRDGYNASANWMPSRVNKLTDNGWSYLTVAPNSNDEMEFKVETDNSGKKAFEVDPSTDSSTGGIFNYNSYEYSKDFDLNLMPLGSVDNNGRNYYMKFNGSGMTDQMSSSGQSYMQRISSNPLTRETYNAYIDIGVYEYQHRTLKINQGSEIDVIWVTDKENPQTGNDGYSWETATSNIQVAIETLLKSRNNHGKRLNIIAGSYKPMTVVNGNLGYTIQTSAYNDGVYTPFIDEYGSTEEVTAYGVKYINLRGGYDKQIPDEGGYNYQKNQVIFSMEQRTGVKEEELNHILNIADVEQYKTTVVPEWEYGENEYIITGFTVNSQPTGEAIPVIVEGITFENTLAQGGTEGAAISYKAQKKHAEGQTDQYLEEPTDELNKYKLTIRNCTFSRNGKVEDEPSCAIKIEEGGGQALIVNSVFHSNSGAPVDAVNTVILNCTSAMNGGHITLSGEESELHNSVIWQDDQNVVVASDKEQYEGISAGEKMQYNAISGMTADNYHNEPLSDTNNDLEEGPNFLFMNPNDEDPTKRDFRIRPSLRLLDRGDNETYAKFVWPGYAESDDYIKLMQNKHDDQTVEQEFTTKIREGNEVKEITYRGYQHDKDLDRAFVTRLMNENIDRGAYECTGKGQRVVYVNPEKFGTGLETGSTWEDALGRGNLQRAIDAAAVYVRNRETLAKQDPSHYSSQIAYVFVKGDNFYNEGEITLRDGVHVYGTAPISLEITPNANDEFDDGALNTYITDVKNERSGIVFKSLKAESYTPTYCSSLTSMGEYRLGSVFDGLMINNGVDNESDKPIVNIAEDAKIAIRNCLVIHNRVKKGQPVVNLQGGLMYNTIIYDCFNGEDGYVVNVGNNGYVLNCTVIADDTRQKAITTGSNDYAVHVANTIAINQGASQDMFAPYLKAGANQYTPEDFLTNHRPYWYQLHENSSEIDAAAKYNDAAVKDWLPVVTTTYNSTDYSIDYDNYVDFNTDRDLLGNPRKIGDKVDNGCFETWKISETVEVTTTAHNYPHPGSVVYIMDDANLKLKAGDFTVDNPLVPGYLLVKESGSLYGQGNHITATYVAIEKSIDSQYSLISVPFKCNPLSTVSIGYSTGAVTQTKPAGLTGSTYDGEERSKWNYHYQAENSTCWKPQTDFVPANTGWLLSLSAAPESPTTYRFTGWGESQTSYIYTEDGNSKTVTLVQHNSMPTDGSAHFTKEENMGWNLVGMPWLVSRYKTKDQMAVPHVIYGNLGETSVANQFHTGGSWADDITLSPGIGFFTQTAVLDDEETLTFALPVYSAPSLSRSASQCVAISRSGYEDVVTVYPDAESDGSLAYRLGSDGLKWNPFDDNFAQIFIESNEGVRMSLVSEAPVEQEMNLGISAPEAGDYTISLPNPEAYSDYDAVWITDTESGNSVNLLNESFVITASQAGDITGRLKLKFGGQKPSDDAVPSVMKVATRYGHLNLKGISKSETIRVYNVNGVLVYSGSYADINNLHLPDGVYIIKH
jgi:hypothetical protein